MRLALDIPPGLFTDDTAFAMPGAWETGSNVRFRLGRPQVIGGWGDILSGSTVTGVCRNAWPWINSNFIVQIAYGTHSNLELLKAGTLYDITPAGLIAGSANSSSGAPGYGSGAYSDGTYGDPSTTFYARTWSFANYGDNLIANPRGGTIYEWEGNTASLATAITNAPSIVTTCLVTPERQLLAFGCNEEVSGDFNGLCIRGSDIEDITDWTTSVTNNAFEHILEGRGGRIVGARLIGHYVAVWTDQGLHLGQYLGDPGQTYRFDDISHNCGLAAVNAVAVYEQTAVWLGSDHHFRVWSPGGVPQVLECPIIKDFIDNLDTTQIDKVTASVNTQFGEVWFHYPDTRDGDEASRYIAYSFRESALNERPVWFKGIMARSQAVDAGATAYPVMTTPDGYSYFHEYGTTADGGDLSWTLKSSDTYIEEGERHYMVRRYVPDFEEQDGDITLNIYSRLYPMASATTKGPFTIETTDTKVDFRASGRMLAAEYSGTAYMRMGRPTVDVVAQGKR